MHGFDPLERGSLLAERYRIGEPLGNGGMSFVHRGTDEVLGREVAVKAIVQAGADAAELQRVQSEIDLLATLSHRALVTLFDAGTAVLDGRAVTYLVMELVDGPTLAERTAHEPLAPAEIRRMALDLTEALVVVHARGIVHRDIKPANILLAPSPLPGQQFDAKLADFGIASLVDAARVTATGTVLGTAAYLSPEQAAGERVGPPADIYSLGLVLLETLTGHREYPGSMLESLVARQLRDPEVPDAIDDHWESLLRAMTARDPDARPTAAAVLERLAEAPNGTPLPLASAEDAATSVTPAAAAAGTALLGAQPAPASADATGPIAGAAAAGAATAGAAALVDDAASDTKELAAAPVRRRRRGWTIAATVTAGVALLATALAFALQGIALPDPSSTPNVGETSQPPVETDPEQSASPTAPAPTGETATDVTDGDQGDGDEPTPTPEPTPTDTTPTDPAPTEPAPEPEPTEPAPSEPAPTPPTTPEPTQPPAEPSSSAPPPESGSG